MAGNNPGGTETDQGNDIEEVIEQPGDAGGDGVVDSGDAGDEANTGGDQGDQGDAGNQATDDVVEEVAEDDDGRSLAEWIAPAPVQQQGGQRQQQGHQGQQQNQGQGGGGGGQTAPGQLDPATEEAVTAFSEAFGAEAGKFFRAQAVAQARQMATVQQKLQSVQQQTGQAQGQAQVATRQQIADLTNRIVDAQQATHAVFGKNWKAANQTQREARAEIIPTAAAIYQQARARGKPISEEAAMKRATAAVAADTTVSKPAAVRTVEQQVVKAANRQQAKPGNRVATAPAGNKSPRDLAIARLKAHFKD